MNWYGYGHLLPLRTLEEIRFSKEQEKEHTLVIRALVPDLEPPTSSYWRNGRLPLQTVSE